MPPAVFIRLSERVGNPAQACTLTRPRATKQLHVSLGGAAAYRRPPAQNTAVMHLQIQFQTGLFSAGFVINHCRQAGYRCR